MSDAFEQLLKQAAQARREKRHADARRDLLEAVALERNAPAHPETAPRQDPNDLARALAALGQTERDTGHGTDALARYQEAASIYRLQSNTLKLAHSLRHVGDIHRDAGRPAEAEPYYHQALALYRANPETPSLDLANAIRPLALLKHDAGLVEEAEPLWEEAKLLYESVNVLPGVAECAARLALLARRRGNSERARALLAEASEAAQNSGDYESAKYVNQVRTWIAG